MINWQVDSVNSKLPGRLIELLQDSVINSIFAKIIAFSYLIHIKIFIHCLKIWVFKSLKKNFFSFIMPRLGQNNVINTCIVDDGKKICRDFLLLSSMVVISYFASNLQVKVNNILRGSFLGAKNFGGLKVGHHQTHGFQLHPTTSKDKNLQKFHKLIAAFPSFWQLILCKKWTKSFNNFYDLFKYEKNWWCMEKFHKTMQMASTFFRNKIKKSVKYAIN